MAWKFASSKNSDPEKVIDDIEEELNKLVFENTNNLVALSAKVALSNRKSGNSFGVVFFDTNVKIQAPPTKTIKFTEKTFKRKEDDPEPLYKDVVDLLNSLVPEEAFWAQVAMSDRQSEDTRVTLYIAEVAN